MKDTVDSPDSISIFRPSPPSLVFLLLAAAMSSGVWSVEDWGNIASLYRGLGEDPCTYVVLGPSMVS